MPFKVTNFSTNQKPICDFLLLINTNLHSILYCFKVIADYCSNFGQKTVIRAILIWGLEATYTVHLHVK